MDDTTQNVSLGDEGYQFDDDFSASPSSESSSAGSNDRGGFAKELFTKTVHAKFRTFYIDVKESRNGKFVKISEKSRGRKSTVMMDAEDVASVLEALTEAKKHI